MRTRYQEYTGTAKIAVMTFLLIFSCGLTYHFHAKFDMGTVFTHFFYVPIVLACIWWKRRGLVVPVFLAAMLIVSHFTIRLPLVSVNDYFRAFMFVFVGTVSVVLSEQIARQNGLLTKSEARFQTMVAGIPGMVYQFRLNPDGSMSFPFISEGCKEFFDVSPEEVQRNAGAFLDLMSPEDRKAFRRSVAASAESLLLLDFSGQAIVADEEKWFRALARPERQPNGDTFWNGVFVDISDIRQAERIKHLNAVLRAIRNVNQLIVREKDRGRLLQSTCDNLIETRGYHNAWIVLLDKAGGFVTTAEGGLGARFKPMLERLRNTELPRCGLKALKQSGVVVTAGTSSECTDCPLSGVDGGGAGMAVRLKHGGVIYGLLSVSIPAKLANDAEEQDLLIEVAGDIAFALHDIELTGQHKSAEEALRQSEEQYRTIFESATDALLIFGLDGTVVEANPAACVAYGYSHEEIIGLSGNDIIHPTHYHLFEDLKEQVGATGQFFAESVDVRKDRSTFDVEVRVTTITFKGKDHLMALVRDISKRKHAEEETAKLEAQLRQSVKMEAIGRLAGGIAHDFNNMLAIIQGYADLMLKSMSKDDSKRDDVESIRTAAKRAAALTRQLLAFGRKQTIQPRVLDLNEVVADTDSMLRRIIGEDIELVTVPFGNLWRVRADPSQIEEQVILNLAVNAREAMPDGGRLTIETSNITLDDDYVATHAEAIPGDYAMLAVSDTGIGMTEEVKSHIFEPFFTTKEANKGSGLGLPTTYGIVKQSGGYIWVYSEPGKGTTFKIYLPRVETPAEHLKRENEPDILPRGTETVLVAEDEPLVRDLACRILREQGYTVMEASDGREALSTAEKFADGKIHLLLTDVVMPHMSGKDLADRIKTLHPNIKVLYISGYTENTIVHHGVLDEGVNFLAKPFSSRRLAKTVRRVCDANI